MIQEPSASQQIGTIFGEHFWEVFITLIRRNLLGWAEDILKKLLDLVDISFDLSVKGDEGRVCARSQVLEVCRLPVRMTNVSLPEKKEISSKDPANAHQFSKKNAANQSQEVTQIHLNFSPQEVKTFECEVKLKFY